MKVRLSKTKSLFSNNAWRSFLRKLWAFSALLLVILAIVFTLFRALTPWVKQYRLQIQTQLSLLTGQEVHIKDLETSWYWFTPVLRLDEVTIQDAQHHELYLNQVMIGINLWHSLWHWHLQPGVLYVEGAHFIIQQKENGWKIAGLNAFNTAQNTTQTHSNIEMALGLLISQDKLIIKQVSADIELQDGTKIPIQSINLKANHHSNSYRLFAKVIMAQASQTSLTVIANLNVNAENSLQASGQVYLALNNANIKQWQLYFPKGEINISSGEGGFEAWVALKHGQIKHVQSLVAFTDLRIHSHEKTHSLEFLSGNIFWNRLTQGWRLSADQLAFNLDKIDWPENAFILEYKEPNDQFQLYVKSLPLNQLLKAKIDWPNSMKPVLALKPMGTLHDTQVFWRQGEINSFLTQFSHLSWKLNKQLPGLTNLFGALYWQPSEGRLEIDGDHSVLTLSHLKPLTFDIFNMALDWKDLSQGMRVSLDRLVLSHPNLVLSASGVIDNPNSEAANVRLKADFAAKEAQFWLPYIPSAGLKPKFDEWLKQDIPRIGQASGRLVIVGPWADFPFDNQNGEFTIHSHVNDVDILINKGWPINRNVNADINVNKRRLVANINQAELMGASIHQVSIVVPDIGLGKESLLLHGTVNAAGEQIKSYVFASPLGKKLARWHGLKIDKDLGLDLSLEVPLYPESDHVYAKGNLKFQNNPVSIQVLEKPAFFEGVKGKLQFNEYGLTDGGLDGILEGYPFTLRVQPLLKDKLGTELRFEGDVAIDYLQKLVPHPSFSLMKGRLILTGLWTVYPSDTDIDKLYINSSLIGMALDLPPPLGKSISEIAPITVNINFHPQHKMDLELDYAQRLTGKMSITEKPHQIWNTTGDIRLGSTLITTPNKTGLRLSGKVNYIDVNEWQQVWNKWPKDGNASSVLDSLQMIDLHVNKLKVLDSLYTNLGFRARYNHPKEWSFHIEQAIMSGDFIYNWTKNNLSGRINHLDIVSKSSSAGATANWQPKMSTIPNLDMSISSLNYNGTELGEVDINTSTKSDRWILNACTIQTPEYQLSLQGEWVKQDKKHNSNIEAQLYIKTLAKSLERWHITPAIDAKNGQMKMTGKWPGPFYAFSLKKLVGHMQLTLKNGLITHLDKETEEKLVLGKLLSVLSLQTIPRRLKLDFSDLSQQGYSFDVFKGDFDINRGVMSTSDSYIDGPVAYGRIQGNLDLINRLYDVDLRISPYITASLPVVATIAGGPIAGLATWALSSLASKGMQKISGYSYKISGPWLDPVVQQVSIDRSTN